MTRTYLDQELQKLDFQIMELGSLVDHALERALDALETSDQAKAGMVIESDTLIDGLRVAIEEHTIRLLTMQQPLGSRDLRYLTAALAIGGDLERTGDGAAGIAQIMLRMSPLRSSQPAQDLKIDAEAATETEMDGNSKVQIPAHEVTESSILKGLLDLGYEARRILQGTMEAFKERSVEKARQIWQEDDVVDVRYHLVRHDLMAMQTAVRAIPALQKDALILQRMTYLLWIAHKLERVADHCTNICERVIFIEEGEANVVI